jgi:UV DNA damage endonuclease
MNPTFVKKNIKTDFKSEWSGQRYEIIWNYSKHMVDLGLCCINSVLRLKTPSIFPNRTCRLATAQKKGLEYVKDLALQNVKDVLTLLDWNKENGIRSYRLSSQMFPHINNPNFDTGYNKKGMKYSLKFVRPFLTKIGIKAKQYGIRLSFHPGHFNQVASQSIEVFKSTIIDLYIHCKIFGIIEKGLDMGENKGILCIHGGGIYGDKKKTMKRWCERFNELPKSVRERICLENCEKCYSSEDCLELSEKLNIPHIFDIHHYHCYDILHTNESQKPISELLPRIFATWHKRNIKPYFHISEQGSGKTGHHSDYVTELPDYIIETKYPLTIDIEAKAKEQAVLFLAKKYNI